MKARSWWNMTAACREPRDGRARDTVLEVRRTTLGYVSQFLRVVPRGLRLDIVAEPLQSARGDGGRSAEACGRSCF